MIHSDFKTLLIVATGILLLAQDTIAGSWRKAAAKGVRCNGTCKWPLTCTKSETPKNYGCGAVKTCCVPKITYSCAELGGRCAAICTPNGPEKLIRVMGAECGGMGGFCCKKVPVGQSGGYYTISFGQTVYKRQPSRQQSANKSLMRRKSSNSRGRM